MSKEHTFIGLPESVPATEFSESFAQGMADRMAVSYFKYGLIEEAYPQKISALASLKSRLQLYEKGGEIKGTQIDPGNTEWLLDVANFAMIEYLHPSVSGAKMCSQGDTGTSPGRTWNTGEVSEKANKIEFKYLREGD